MKALVVTRDATQLRALTEVFGGHYNTLPEGLTLETADSAFFALTRLERDTPDLIISAREVGMSGAEFLEIVRDDTLSKTVPFILLDETVLGHFTPTAHEIVLEERAHPAVVLGAATSLLARSAEEDDERAELARPVCLQGTTELVSPFDLLNLLAGNKSTGLLSFDLGNRAVLYLAEGRLVHAEYGQVVGEAALTEMFRVVQEGPVRFDYRPAATSHMPGEAAGRTTLNEPLQVLLLRVALELDRSA